MGPMVIAGVLVDNDSELKEMGVKDSKKLTPSKREVLGEKIRASCRYEVVIASAEDIDTLRQSFTMNVIESKMFATIVERLGAEKAYLDAADSNEEEFKRLVSKELDMNVEIISKHGADDLYPVVSAASIIAKTTRDSMVQDIKEELGQDIGSGYPSDPTTIEFLKSWYREHGDMPPHTRRTWKTVNRIINELSITSLDNYEG